MKLKKIEKFFDFYIKKFFEYPLQRLDDQIFNSQDDYLIPPIVYQTWENNLFGKTHYKQILKFRETNHDLTFLLFDKKKRDEYMIERWSDHEILKVYQTAKLGVMKSDIFRHCILYDQGGYYFDISRGCSIPLTKLHNKFSKFILTYEDTPCYIPPMNKNLYSLKRPFNHILQWGLAFEKKNKFLEILLNKIVEAYPNYKNKTFENPKLAILNFTGPGMYTLVMREYLSRLSTKNISELDIKFNNKGIFKLKGSQLRYQIQPSYTYLKNKKICS